MARRGVADREGPRPDPGDGTRPLRPVVLSTAVFAGCLLAFALAAATMADRVWLAFPMALVLHALGWGGGARTERSRGVWAGQVEDARSRSSAIVEPRVRTVLVGVAMALAVGVVVVPFGALVDDMTAVSIALALASGVLAYGAWWYARWERQSHRRLLAVTRWVVGVRRPLVAVPAAASIAPATGAG